MVNILLNTFRFAEPWYQPTIGRYLKPAMSVLVFPFAFRPEQIPSAQEWEKFYNPIDGTFSMGLAAVFGQYGIPISQMEWVNYYEADSSALVDKIADNDVLYFCGGEPDLLYQRLCELKLLVPLKCFDGIVMGDSAGAVIQFDRYHDQPGLGYLQEFDLEVHFTGDKEQEKTIQEILHAHKRPVFALRPNGALVVADGRIHSMGDVMCVFPANKDSEADVAAIDAVIAEAEAEVQNGELMDASEALSTLKKRYFGEKTDY